MSQKILVAQSIEELEYLILNINFFFRVLPLNLKTQIYCVEKKIDFIDLSNILDNEIHKKIILDADLLLKKIDYQKFTYSSINKDFKGWLRFRIYSYLFLNIVINKIDKIYPKSEIVVSGWDSLEALFSSKNYFISGFIANFYKKKITIVKKNKKIYSKLKTFDFKFQIKNKNDKPGIIISNFGYNFKRILFWSLKNKKKIIYFTFFKCSLFKKIIFKLLNIKLFEIKQTPSKNNLYIKKLLPKLVYSNQRFDNILIHQKTNLLTIFNTLINKANSIKKIVLTNNIDLAISNVSRGVDGCLLEISKKDKIKTVCIPHGTLSKHYNRYDQIYKKNISEAILDDYADFTASQSKIIDSFFVSKKPKSKIIKTGNLIFNSNSQNTGTCILYAVTIKDFFNMQFIGVETYYEYYNNLFFLDKLAKKNRYKIIVKPHPTEFDCIEYLNRKFKNLHFTKEKNETLFKKVRATISFSSTIIEDSLCSSVPVILLDRWNRYKHCQSETNPLKISNIYYVKTEKNLLKCLQTIFKNNCNIFFKNKRNSKTNTNLNNFFSKIKYEKKK